MDCLQTSWISSLGQYVELFERKLAHISGTAHGIAVSNGTVALHLAHHCMGLQPGDEVLVPTFTYIASVNTIRQTGATPVFVDCREGDWLIDVNDARSKVTPRTKGIVAVHLYGAICDMPAILDLAREHNLYVIEDCAEALGATLAGRPAGCFGDIGTFSFFGNKTVTTGEGGMVVTQSDDLAVHMRITKGQGQDPTRRYWHDRMGFNYRMTNIAAAIGCAQLERIKATLDRKAKIAERYRSSLVGTGVEFQLPSSDVVSSNWLVSLLLPDGICRDTVMERLKRSGIDSRPAFHCVHKMPMYEHGKSASEDFPVAENVSRRGLSLPSFPSMTDEMIDWTCEALADALASWEKSGGR